MSLSVCAYLVPTNYKTACEVSKRAIFFTKLTSPQQVHPVSLMIFYDSVFEAIVANITQKRARA